MHSLLECYLWSWGYVQFSGLFNFFVLCSLSQVDLKLLCVDRLPVLLAKTILIVNFFFISLKTMKAWCLKKLQCRRLETWSSSTVYSINEGIWMNFWTNTWLFYLEPVDAYESHESNPSVLHDLKLEVTSTDEGPALKVSWAVRVDGEIGQRKCIRNISVCSKSRKAANDMPVLFQFSASTSSLTGLWLEVSQRDPLWCQYSPPFNSFSIMDVDLVCFTG